MQDRDRVGMSSVKSRAANGRDGRPNGRLDPAARVPLYHQLFVILRNRIYGGELSAGDLVPGEQDLCSEFGVSRITAKRALNELADAGLVIRERGKGTRVVKRPPPPAVTASIEGWLENISLMGIVTEARVLEFAYVPASEDIGNALELEQGTEVQRAVRVRILDGQPMSFLITYVPRDIGLQYDREDLNAKPLLHLLERAGVEVASARQTISATVADPDVAGALDPRRRAVDRGAARRPRFLRPPGRIHSGPVQARSLPLRNVDAARARERGHALDSPFRVAEPGRRRREP